LISAYSSSTRPHGLMMPLPASVDEAPANRAEGGAGADGVVDRVVRFVVLRRGFRVFTRPMLACSTARRSSAQYTITARTGVPRPACRAGAARPEQRSHCVQRFRGRHDCRSRRPARLAPRRRRYGRSLVCGANRR